MVEIGALDFEECALESGNALNHSVFREMIDMIIFGHIPGVGCGNEPLEKAGRGGAAFVDSRIPNPKSAVPIELRIGCETKQTPLIISLWNRITEPGKSGNMASKSSYLRAKVEKDLSRAIRGQAFAVKLSWLRTNE